MLFTSTGFLEVKVWFAHKAVQTGQVNRCSNLLYILVVKNDPLNFFFVSGVTRLILLDKHLIQKIKKKAYLLAYRPFNNIF